MNPRKPTLWFFIFSIVGFGIGYVLTNSVKFGICVYDGLRRDPACLNFYERIGDPIFFGMGALVLVSFVLLFVPKAVKAWSKFAVWSVPLVALMFVLYPTPGGTDYFTPDPETAFKWLSGFYAVLSLIIIGFVSLRKKN